MPLPSTLTPIATNTLTAAAASVTFSNLPQTYTDLVLVTSTKYTTGVNHIRLRYNSDTGSNYSNTVLLGDGSSAVSGRDSNVTFNVIARAGSEFGIGTTHIQSYSNTTTYKTCLSRGNLASSIVIAYVGLYRSTSAVTSITLIADSGNFDVGSTFTIYGVKAA